MTALLVKLTRRVGLTGASFGPFTVAARMESTGCRNKIQISESTYQLLLAAGKHHWVKPRSDAVEAKGKGIMKTFWCEIKQRVSSTAGSSVSGAESEDSQEKSNTKKANPHFRPSQSGLDNAKQQRLVNWIVDMLSEHIRKVVAMRQSNSKSKPFTPTLMPTPGQSSLDEVAEVIYLPRFNEKKFTDAQNAKEVEISDEVHSQLKEYIGAIANMYRDNPFHNFGKIPHCDQPN